MCILLTGQYVAEILGPVFALFALTATVARDLRIWAALSVRLKILELAAERCL